MKKSVFFLFLSLLILDAVQAQRSSSPLIYGTINRSVISGKSKYEVAAQNVKVLLVDLSISQTKFEKSICEKKDNQVKVFFTDSKGEYHFNGLRKGVKYRLVICDTKKNKTYFTELQIPSSGKSSVRVPDQTIL
jgi:hypothetical protein